MAPLDPAALRLRFRERQIPCEPDVAAFARRPSPPPRPAPAPARRERFGVIRGRRPQASRAPLTIFFQYAQHRIPAIESGPMPSPDLGSWSIQPAVFGYLAQVSRPPRGSSRSKVAWLVAACLPLVIPMPALAAPEQPQVQRPTVPTLPEGEPGVGAEEATAEGESSPEAGAEAGTEPEAGGELGPLLPPEVTVGPEQPVTEPVALQPPPPAPDGSISGVDPAVIDAAWEGVDGFEVELELKGGQNLVGRVGAVQRDTFTLIQANTGAVLVLPKSGVVSLRVRVPPDLPDRNGTGLIIGGSILTSIAAPVFISGVTFLGICPSCAYLHLPMLLIGGGGLAGGIPMLIRGARYRKAYREALDERSISPIALRTRYGWTGGLRFRF